MDEYKNSYLLLFRAVTKAIDAIDAQNFGAAKELLIQAQKDAEEAFLQQGTPAN